MQRGAAAAAAGPVDIEIQYLSSASERASERGGWREPHKARGATSRAPAGPSPRRRPGSGACPAQRGRAERGPPVAGRQCRAGRAGARTPLSARSQSHCWRAARTGHSHGPLIWRTPTCDHLCDTSNRPFACLAAGWRVRGQRPLFGRLAANCSVQEQLSAVVRTQSRLVWGTALEGASGDTSQSWPWRGRQNKAEQTGTREPDSALQMMESSDKQFVRIWLLGGQP